MARIHVGIAAFCCMVATAPLLPAQAALAAATPSTDTVVPDVPDGKRSYAQAAFNKIRPGYSLGGPENMPTPEDTQGELGLKRDALVRQHYSHMAQLDAITDAAMRNHDVATAERAEALRRRDTQRFLLQMQHLRRQLLKSQAEMGP